MANPRTKGLFSFAQDVETNPKSSKKNVCSFDSSKMDEIQTETPAIDSAGEISQKNDSQAHVKKAQDSAENSKYDMNYFTFKIDDSI